MESTISEVVDRLAKEATQDQLDAFDELMGSEILTDELQERGLV